jgi:exonuclease VII large subunit
MPVEVTLAPSTARELATLRKKLKEASKELTRDMNRALKLAAKPALTAGKQAARDLPSRSVGQRRDSQGRFAKDARPRLRAEIARAMRTKISTQRGETTLRVVVPKRPLGDRGRLPQLMNRGTWRHPVYGNRDVWVDQRSRAGWFDEAMRSVTPQVKKDVEWTLELFEKRV